MTDKPVPLATLAIQLADMVGSPTEVSAEVATMASMVVRLDVAMIRLDAALNAFSRETARLCRDPTGVEERR